MKLMIPTFTLFIPTLFVGSALADCISQYCDVALSVYSSCQTRSGSDLDALANCFCSSTNKNNVVDCINKCYGGTQDGSFLSQSDVDTLCAGRNGNSGSSSAGKDGNNGRSSASRLGATSKGLTLVGLAAFVVM